MFREVNIYSTRKEVAKEVLISFIIDRDSKRFVYGENRTNLIHLFGVFFAFWTIEMSTIYMYIYIFVIQFNWTQHTTEDETTWNIFVDWIFANFSIHNFNKKKKVRKKNWRNFKYWLLLTLFLFALLQTYRFFSCG